MHELNRWIDEQVALLRPDKAVWIKGGDWEYQQIADSLVQTGGFTRLNEDRFPNCYWHTSDPTDVARVEDRTFICTPNREEAGPTNNWADPRKMDEALGSLMRGAMKGRTMYVIPYLMGPVGSPYSRVGFELTDSAYVAANMHIMTRVGRPAMEHMEICNDGFVRGVHATGSLDPSQRFIAHYPQENRIVSVNSNYGGNALQGKKCFALRLASYAARQEGWLAEHMLILGIKTPSGGKHYICAAFPSACGKTNLAMLVPPPSYRRLGWEIEVLGDDIAWLHFGKGGRLYALNPEAGFFGVAPGTSLRTNPSAMQTIRSNTIFTNTALRTSNKTPWWEGLTRDYPPALLDWRGQTFDPASGQAAAHPNSRFTTPARQCPSISPNWEDPLGVPISAILFGGRRARTMPLVLESFSWQHGTFLGATMASESTAAANGETGNLRRDPMAMRPFLGYHMGDYFAHWLRLGQARDGHLPKVFHVNWFRKREDGQFSWPGYKDNMRVLEWVIKRCEGHAGGMETPLGIMPLRQEMNMDGLDLSKEDLDALFDVDEREWSEELESQKALFTSLSPALPSAMWDEHRELRRRLGL